MEELLSMQNPRLTSAGMGEASTMAMLRATARKANERMTIDDWVS